MSNKNFLICDLDGTACDEEHRVHHGRDHQDWDAYFSKLDIDEPYEDVRWLLEKSQGKHVLFVTCRPEKYRDATVKWLRKYGILFTDLLMRPDGDETPSQRLKLIQLEKYFGSREEVLKNVFLVLEDRCKVVSAMRQYGLTVWQCRECTY